MNLYSETLDYLLHLKPIAQWPGVQEQLRRAAAEEPHDWRLPLLACKAVGGSPRAAIPAAAAVACLQISIILVDDMLDADPRGTYRDVGMPAAANLAIAFQAAALEAILESNTRLAEKLAALRSLNAMALTTARGQYLDVQDLQDEAAYWHLVRVKSSPFFGAALHAGALLGNAPADVAEKLRRFGHLYGEAVQIHDDLNDVMATPANPDWIQGRSPLPILYARLVSHPERERFLALRSSATDPHSLAEAQKVLLRSGAISYSIHQLLGRYRQSRRLLGEIALVNGRELEDLLEGLVDPVWTLLTTVGGGGVMQKTADSGSMPAPPTTFPS